MVCWRQTRDMPGHRPILVLCMPKAKALVQNYKEASKWFKLAAEQGFALSKCFLAEMYINGHGIKRNPSMAKKMAKEGYEAGQTTVRMFGRNTTSLITDCNRRIA